MSLGRRIISTDAGDAVCLTESVQPFGADSTYSSNIATYQLDGNDNDTTTNYNGISDANVTYSSTGAYIGQAAIFNGSNAYIDLGTSIASSTRGVSMWVYADDFTERWAFQQGDGQGVENYIRFYNTDDIQVRWGNVTQTFSGYSANTWYHIFAQKDENDNANVWINGVEMGSTGTPSAIAVNKTHLGVRYNGGSLQYYFKGKIDQVRIFNKALNAQDIATLYAETSSTASNTNPFSEGAGLALLSFDTDASDASGYFDGVPTDVTFGVGGKTSYAGRFNGSSSIIRFADNSFKNTTFSVSMWVKSSDWTQSYVTLFNAYDNDGTNGGASFGVHNDKAWIFAAGGASSPSHYVSTGTSLTDNAWQHLVYRVSGTSLKAYLNNSEVLDVTIGSNLAYRTNHNFNIGAREITGTSGTNIYGYVNADIDQFRYFTSALTTDQISTLYNSGNGETACVHTATTTDVDYPTTNVAYYKFDNSAEDSHSGTYDGTQVGDVEYRFGKYGQAAVFNGSNSYITVPNLAGFTNYNFTMSFWFNSTSTATQYFMDFRNPIYMEFGYDIGSGAYNNTYSFVIYTGTQYAVHSSANLRDGNWHHIAVTYDGATLKMYIDNASPITSTINDNTQSAGSGNVIGGAVGGSSIMDGKIDQLRIFSSELSSSQVTQLYNEKPEIDTSNFRAILYKGTSSKQYISNVGFNLDVDNGGDGGYVWIKQRTTPTRHHRNYDTVRGVYPLYSSLANAEGTSNPIEYDANGFFFAGGESGVNENAEDYVAWVWRGGGTPVQNNDGTIQGANCMVSANTEAGFSIVKYTGNNTDGATVGHGLGVAPNIVIVKDLDSSNYWCVGGSTVGTGQNLYLNDRELRQTRDRVKSVQTNTFTLGNHFETNSTNDFIAYCFAQKDGFSRISTYEGNGTNDNKIYTTDDGTSTGSNGFKPSFVMLKNIDRTNTGWLIHDTARDPVNTSYLTLLANADTNEYTSTSYWMMDFESDGFRLKYGASNENEFNKPGDTYLFMAFK
tara:strand:+ start:1836 stop:4865 length:3030 start_codon:yes stop_codon:yes gene_type:complete